MEKGQTCLTEGEKHPEFNNQLISFPHGHDDGPDCAGMIKHELNLRWSPAFAPRSPFKDVEKHDERLKKRWEADNYPWVAQQKKGQKQHQAQIRKMKRYGLWAKKGD